MECFHIAINWIINILGHCAENTVRRNNGFRKVMSGRWVLNLPIQSTCLVYLHWMAVAGPFAHSLCGWWLMVVLNNVLIKVVNKRFDRRTISFGPPPLPIECNWIGFQTDVFIFPNNLFVYASPGMHSHQKCLTHQLNICSLGNSACLSSCECVRWAIKHPLLSSLLAQDLHR